MMGAARQGGQLAQTGGLGEFPPRPVGVDPQGQEAGGAPPRGTGAGGGDRGGGPRRAEAGGHTRDKQFQVRGGIERVGGGGELRHPPPVEPPGRPCACPRGAP